MKTIITKVLVVFSIFLLSTQLDAQTKINKLEIEGDALEIVTSKSMTADVTGTLSSGESLTTECFQGMCYVSIDYKGRKVAFCCAGCPSTWDKLSDPQKQAKVPGVKF